MANEPTKEKKVRKSNKVAEPCILSKTKYKCTNQATTRGLCGTHYQAATSIVNSEPATKDAKGNVITWEYLEKVGRALAPSRQSVASFFIDGL